MQPLMRRKTQLFLGLLMTFAAVMISGCPVSSKATVSFTATPITGVAALTVQFRGDVHTLPPYLLEEKFRDEGVPTLTVVRYMWSFGDGTVGNGRNPAHTYTTPGKYLVTMQAVISEQPANTISVTPPYTGLIIVLAPNTPPVANAGPDQVLRVGEQAALDGSGSYDADGDPLTYAWGFVSVPGAGTENPSAAELDDPTSMTPSFLIDRPGDYILRLVVNDGESNSLPDTVTITAMRTSVNIHTSMGDSPNLAMTIECGDSYVPPEVTATDTLGNDITDRIIVGGDTVDPNTVGAYVVTYDVTDEEGNAADRVTLTVTVQDTTPPTAAARDITVNLDANGQAGITSADVDGGSFDSCGLTLAVTPDTFDCSNLGANLVTLTATDVVEQTSIATATVTVVDNLAPTAVAKDITVQLDENGQAAITPEDVDAGSTDNCAVSLDVSPNVFSCEHVGSPVSVTLIATDPSGNTSAAEALVTVLDTIAPTAASQDIIVQLDANGVASISGADVDAGSSDNCAVNLSVFPDTFTCDDIVVGGEEKENGYGSVTVTLTVTDPSGNTNTAEAHVTVVDALAPTVLAKDITIQLDANGQASIAPEDVDNGSSDNCSIALSVYPDTFTCADVQFPVAVTLTGYDPSGNSDTTQAMVTVVDNIPPAALARDVTVQLDENGQGRIVPDDVDAGSTDNCSVSLEVFPNTFSCDDVGISERDKGQVLVTLTATDPSGNTDTASAIVTVLDTIAPTAVAQDITVELDGNGQATIIAEDVDAGSSDNCEVFLSVFPDTFTCDDVFVQGERKENGYGSVLVTLAALDPAGNVDTAEAYVTVMDTLSPTVLAKDITVELDANGQASITPDDVDNGSSDNCAVSLFVYPDMFSCADLQAPITVTLTGYDPSGNSNSAQALVTVVDNIAPAALAQDITVQLDENGQGAIVPGDVDAGSTDNCSVVLDVFPNTFSCDDAGPGGEFKGQVLVTLTATDPSGNTDTASATVTVLDTIAPTAIAQNITVQLDENGQASITGEDVDAGSFDNCAVLLSVFPDTFTCADAIILEKENGYGIVAVTLTATDPSGNTDTTEAYVTVMDTLAPTVLAKDITVQLDAGGEASITADDVDNGSSDNCQVWLGVEPSTFSCEDVGSPVTVTLTGWDPSGNSDTAQAMVTVEDNIPPTAAASPMTSLFFFLDENGQVTITPQDIDYGSSDNCSVILSVDPNTFTCDDVGDMIWVTLTATDPSGNSDTDQSMIMVMDNLAPTAVAQDITVQLDENGVAMITGDDVDAGSSDNCSVVLSVFPDSFSCDDLTGGTTKIPMPATLIPVTLTATDPSANSDTAAATVTLEDTIAPTVIAKDITVQLDENGQVCISPEDVDNGSSDNCSIWLQVEPNCFSCEDVAAPVTVTLTGWDQSGNSNSAQALVTVEDNIPPTAEASPFTSLYFYLDENGQVTITPQDIDYGSSDNCSVELSVDPDTFTCDDAGQYIVVTLTATDPGGNSDTDTAIVGIMDVTAPTAVAKDITVQLDENGEASITGDDVDGGSTDNCAVFLNVEPNTFTCADLWPEEKQGCNVSIPVTLTADDGNYNTDTDVATVTLVDSLPPVITLNGSSTVIIPCGGEYTEESATVDDNCEGEFPMIVDSSAVNVDVPGNYEVTYDSYDYCDNNAETVVRTVIVLPPCTEDCLRTVAPPGLPGLCYDFETDLDGFTLAGTANLWHRTDVCPALTAPNGSSYVLYFGQDLTCDYDTGAAVQGTATSPVIDLTASTGPVLLKFDYIVATDQIYDVATVEISTDGSAFTGIASNLFYSGLPWLCDGGIPDTVNAASTEKRADDGGSKLPSATWQTGVIDITSYVGNSINIRFGFDSVDEMFNDYLGYAVDEICIYDYSEVCGKSKP